MEEKTIKKTMCNCSAVEFFKQCNKIRKSVAKLYRVCNIAEIRKKLPDLSGLSPEEYAKYRDEQAKSNFSEILDVLLEEHTQETIEIIGEMCFLTPDEAMKCDGIELFTAALELVSNKNIIDFFLSVAKSMK